MAFDPSKDRASVEAFYTARRLTELRLRPVEGQFDVQHLKEVNRRIFQDMPGQGYDDVRPGEFRVPTPTGRDWVKHRRLEAVGISTHVAYSPMDETAQATLAARLSRIDVVGLKSMGTDAFARHIASLYADLDYIHPFADGNSRTLREFTRSLADEAGFELRWERFGDSVGGRDVLYVARDLMVNRVALPQVRQTDTRRDLTFTLDQLEGNRDLTDLFLSGGSRILQPKRAEAFEKLNEVDAVARFPELAPLYGQRRSAESHSHALFPDSAEDRARFQAGVQSRIQVALDANALTVDLRGRSTQHSPGRADPER